MVTVAIFTLDMTMNGASRALIEMLKRLDYRKVAIDVYIPIPDGEYMNQFPPEVHLIHVPRYKKNIPGLMRQVVRHPVHFLRASIQGIRLRPGVNKIVECDAASKRMPPVDKVYDVAISYRHYNIDTFYVINNLKAKRKFFWIHGEVCLSSKEVSILDKYYKKYDRIFAVSQTAKDSFLHYFPQYSEKCKVAYNVIDREEYYRLAKQGPHFSTKDKPIILSIGRLSEEKGYDLSLDACRILKEKGMNFIWYIIGDGKERIYIQKEIERLSLQHEFVLLGMVENPYGYLEDCNIYVQSSRSESYCLTLAEARSFFRPIVTTDIPAAREQLRQNQTALFSDLNAKDLAEQIEKLLVNKVLREELTSNLKKENSNNFEVIDIFMNEVGAD